MEPWKRHHDVTRLSVNLPGSCVEAAWQRLGPRRTNTIFPGCSVVTQLRAGGLEQDAHF